MSAVNQSYYRENFLISTSKAFIQFDALGAAFQSDVLWWAAPVSEEVLRHIVLNSLCFGLYEVTNNTRKKVVHTVDGENSEPSDLKMIGFGRLVTDYVTFGYLTDVYVLPEHQGKGLGRWLLQCINQELCQWPELRRVMLLCSSASCKLYTDSLGMVEWEASLEATKGLACMGKAGPGVRKKDNKNDENKPTSKAEAGSQVNVEQVGSHSS